MCPSSLRFHRGKRRKSCLWILGFLWTITPEALRRPRQKWKNGFPMRRKFFTATTICWLTGSESFVQKRRTRIGTRCLLFSFSREGVNGELQNRKRWRKGPMSTAQRFSCVRLHQSVNEQSRNTSRRENKWFGKQRKSFPFPVKNAPTNDEARSESDSQYGKGLHRLTNWFANCCIRRVTL